MGTPGNFAGPAAVGESMPALPLPDGWIPNTPPALQAEDTGSDANSKQQTTGRSLLICLLRALSAWHH
jgi:hypothetical protein